MRRREFLAQIAGPAALRGADPRSSYANDLQDMLLSFLSGKLNALADRWDAERSKIRTPDSIEARNGFVREKFREMVHGFPEKTPLEPVVAGAFERNGYRVENVMFQSRPNFWVTGNLYVPTTGNGPFPGIISPCGHYPLARMQPDYQFAYLNLVRSGFVVLAYDPIGQGERRHYWNPQTGQTESGLNSIYEHSMPGQLLLMLGEDLTHYRIWDGMRAIDYLLLHPQVDKQRIGCAGHSGGGTLTLFISALDERVRCAVVNEGGTGHRWPVNLQPESRIGPSDIEQNLFPAAKHGIDLCDLHVAIAPRPLLALIEDYAPPFNLAAEHIRARYQQLGVPAKFATEEATDPHAWTLKLRQATTDWFCRWFYDRPGPTREPEFQPEPPENLYCTPNGSVRYSHHGATIFSVILKKAELLPRRQAPPRAGEIRDLLRIRMQNGALGARSLVTTQRKGYQIEKVEFLSEPGIYIPAWVFVPEESRRVPARTILWVSEAGKQADAMEFGTLEALARRGRMVVAVDVRGIGETRPPHTPSITEPPGFRHLFDVETAMSYMAWFMDESLFGMRVTDVLRSVDYVLGRPDADPSGVALVGNNAGALWGLYAAALDSRISKVICEGGLLSYRTLAQADRYLHGASSVIPDVLKHFDLPHVAAAIAPRPLAVRSPVDAMKRPVETPAVLREYGFTAETYRREGALEKFRINGGGDPIEGYLDL